MLVHAGLRARLNSSRVRPLCLGSALIGYQTPSLSPRSRSPSVRSKTSEAGEHDSGHIEAGPNEGIIYFNNVYPSKLQWFAVSWFSWLSAKQEEHVENSSAAGFNPVEVIKKSLPEDSLVQVTGMIPRMREGGAFVRFSHPDSVSDRDVEALIQKHLEQHPTRPWFAPFRTANAGLVLGRPWIEDLFRLPTQRLKVEFMPTAGNESIELSQERLYSLFRPYGTLLEITKQPSDSKILPKYATLDYASKKCAIMAKACLHGLPVAEEETALPKAKIKLSFEPRPRKTWFTDWFFNHPRVTIPLLAALAAAFTVAVFDPIRTFFVKMHITHKYDVTENKLYQWFSARATDLLSFRKRRTVDNSMDLLVERRDNVEQIQRWLMETADTFVVVQGPRGSGKRKLVLEQALKDRKNVLVIDCKPIQEARGDSKTISAIAEQVGYKPVFSWTNSISGLVDLAVQGATGVKTGFSETLDTQISKILNNTASALKEIALEDRRKDERDAKLTDDVYLEAHPERLPVVVIDNFLHKGQESNPIHDRLAEWAARIASSNVAHVIFLTTDVAFSKSLSKALPDRIFHGITLGDIPTDTAKRFVISHLDADTEDFETDPQEKRISPSEQRTDLGELDSVISALGGRLTDLEFLARRIKAGESPYRAVREIVDQAASEILKMYILSVDRQWAPEQAWLLVKLLAKEESLRYNEVIYSDAYKGSNPDLVLQALEQAELITIISSHGRPALIRAAKPVYRSAFRQLMEDSVLKSRMDLALLSKQIKMENQTIESCETELKLLGKLPKQPPELGSRVQWLLGRVQSSQGKIEKYELKTNELKKILSSEP